MGVDVVMAWYKVLSQYLPERIQKEHKKKMVGRHAEIQS
jgi:hypothetical protein